jgi:hypothetical protein
VGSRRVPVFLLAGLVALLAIGCTDATSVAPSGEPSAEQAVVRQLDSIEELRDRFQEDEEKVRLILLISPT